jgi:DNA-3-methyladenine glycosylase II
VSSARALGREQRAAQEHLSRVDAGLAAIVADQGPVDPYTWSGVPLEEGDLIGGLALHIVAQQISVAVALVIYGRLGEALGGRIDADGLAETSVEEIRGVGVSGAKALALHELGRRVSSGEVDLEGLLGADDETAIAMLVSLRGVGPWSAQMFMVHELRRPDVFPAGDIGLRKALARVDGSEAPLAVDAAARRAQPWSPFRTYAAAYLWAFLHDSSGPGPV